MEKSSKKKVDFDFACSIYFLLTSFMFLNVIRLIMEEEGERKRKKKLINKKAKE